MNRLLNICAVYAKEYNVLFNSTKNKIIVKSCRNTPMSPPTFIFMDGPINIVEFDKHLGNFFGNISNKELNAYLYY